MLTLVKKRRKQKKKKETQRGRNLEKKGDWSYYGASHPEAAS